MEEIMKIFKSHLIAMMTLIAILFTMTLDAQAYSVKQQWARMSATCGETLTTGQGVTLKDADGYAYKADANDAALRPAVGVVGMGCSSGGTVEIIVQGILTGWTGLAESTPGFLSETAGALTQSAPAYSQQIAVAISATDYYVNAQNYFSTASLTALGADVTITGTTPTLTLGDGDDEDAVAIIDGQGADDFYIGFDTTDDDLHIGYGTTPGTQSAISITDSATPGVTVINAFSVNGDTTIGDAVTDDITITAAILGATPLVLDGTTDDTNELTIGLLDDPSADKTVKIPSLTDATVMISSLVTNDIDVANSVWAVSNGLAFGGATGADGFETKLSPTDPAADATITVPNVTGLMGVISTATHDYAAGAADWTLSATELQASHITATNANGAVNAILGSCTAGRIYTITNGTGQTITLKVTGQTGGTVANAKSAAYMCNGTDVVEVFEQP